MTAPSRPSRLSVSSPPASSPPGADAAADRQPSIAERRTRFRDLHRQGCFVLPNPWDRGSAILLEQLGFQALASTSSGAAWSRARADGDLPLADVLDHLRELVAATRVPVNADFENGFADDPRGVADNVALAIGTGVAGLSIEDASGEPGRPIYELPEAVERLVAARAAIDASGTDTLLVGRAEGFLHGQPDLDAIVRRLQAYAGAGADCLYAPGITAPAQIRVLVAAVAPKPLNVLVGAASDLTVGDLANLGVRRISVGGALARMAWSGFLGAATQLAEGRFTGFAGAASGADLNRRFRGA